MTRNKKDKELSIIGTDLLAKRGISKIVSPIERKSSKVEKTLSWLETGLQIAGAFIPFVAVAGVGVGLFNMKYAKQNMEYFAKRLEYLEMRVDKLTEAQERNFTIRVVSIANIVISERATEKIDLFACLIENGIMAGTIFDDSEEFDIITDIVKRLNLIDIEFMEKFHEYTAAKMDDGSIILFHEWEKSSFEDIQYMNKTEQEEFNTLGFRKGSVSTLRRCISYGLIEEKLDKEEDRSSFHKRVFDRVNIINQLEEEKKYNYKMTYQITEMYCRVRKYILTHKQGN